MDQRPVSTGNWAVNEPDEEDQCGSLKENGKMSDERCRKCRFFVCSKTTMFPPPQEPNILGGHETISYKNLDRVTRPNIGRATQARAGKSLQLEDTTPRPPDIV